MNAADGARLTAIVAKTSTVGAARALVGKTTEILATGYTQISSIPTTSVGSFLFGSSTDSGTDARDAATSLLNVVNSTAATVYAELPTDDDSQSLPLTLKQRNDCGTVFREAYDALDFIEKQIADLSFDYFSALDEVLATIGAAIGKGIQEAAKAAGSGVWAFIRACWPTLLFVGLIVGGFFYWRYRGVKSLLKGTS
jgi:hypothetical protein